MSLEENKVTEENNEATEETQAVGTSTTEEDKDSADAGNAAEPAGEQADAPEEEKEEENASAGQPDKTVPQMENWDDDFSKEQWILTHIGDENLMEYLRMEHKREEDARRAREDKQKRILSAFQLTVSLAAVIAVMFLLRDNPTVMVNILYIIAIVAALWIWKNPRS